MAKNDRKKSRTTRQIFVPVDVRRLMLNLAELNRDRPNFDASPYVIYLQKSEASNGVIALRDLHVLLDFANTRRSTFGVNDDRDEAFASRTLANALAQIAENNGGLDRQIAESVSKAIRRLWRAHPNLPFGDDLERLASESEPRETHNLTIRAGIAEDADVEHAARVLADVYRALNDLHVAFGGHGLHVDEWRQLEPLGDAETAGV